MIAQAGCIDRHFTIALGDAATDLGLARGTISMRQRSREESRLQVEARGRPVQSTDCGTRDGVVALFQLIGPGVGLPVLRELFGLRGVLTPAHQIHHQGTARMPCDTLMGAEMFATMMAGSRLPPERSRHFCRAEAC